MWSQGRTEMMSPAKSVGASGQARVLPASFWLVIGIVALVLGLIVIRIALASPWLGLLLEPDAAGHGAQIVAVTPGNPAAMVGIDRASRLLAI
jgi:hypothetical protein